MCDPVVGWALGRNIWKVAEITEHSGLKWCRSRHGVQILKAKAGARLYYFTSLFLIKTPQIPQENKLQKKVCKKKKKLSPKFYSLKFDKEEGGCPSGWDQTGSWRPQIGASAGLRRVKLGASIFNRKENIEKEAKHDCAFSTALWIIVVSLLWSRKVGLHVVMAVSLFDLK